MDDRMPPPGEDADLGAPVAELALLDDAPPDGFLEAVRRSVLRRIGAVDALDFGVPAFAGFLRAMLDLIFGGVGGAGPRNGRHDA